MPFPADSTADPRTDSNSDLRLAPELLISLNADLELSRAAVCRLAAADEPWWCCQPAELGAVAAKLGVTTSTLATARRTIAQGDATADDELRRARELDVRILTLHDDEYPRSLLDLALPPPVLYLRGQLPTRPCLSIVGARKASVYGREVAGAFGAALAARGLTVVSGFARGIDATAHRAAVGVEGATVAVLGCGLDVDYPRGRRALRRDVCRRGALLSEFPFGASPLPMNFPIRNRLIAALGHGTLVVEATARSGSLITARLALELGRDVYATPGRIFDGRAAGPNALIRDGAFLAQHPEDILITLPQAVIDRMPAPGRRKASAPPPRLPADQASVLAALRVGGRTSEEELIARVDLPVQRLLTALLDLELAGWVRREPGPSYARCELW